MCGSTRPLDTRQLPRTTRQNGDNGGSTRSMLTCTSSWARTTSTSIPSTSRQWSWAMAEIGPCCTICRLPVSLSFAGSSLQADRHCRVLELRERQVLEEQEPRCLRPRRERDWCTIRCLEILPALYAPGDRRCYVLVVRIREYHSSSRPLATDMVH